MNPLARGSSSGGGKLLSSVPVLCAFAAGAVAVAVITVKLVLQSTGSTDTTEIDFADAEVSRMAVITTSVEERVKSLTHLLATAPTAYNVAMANDTITRMLIELDGVSLVDPGLKQQKAALIRNLLAVAEDIKRDHATASSTA